MIQNASVITHNINAKDYPTNDAMMDYARELESRYAKAKLVVTSRIHCALPCLAVETPVIYVQSENLESMQKRSPGRMKGLIDLFNVLYYDKKVFCAYGRRKISTDTQISNSDKYKKYRNSLIETVKAFTKNEK